MARGRPVASPYTARSSHPESAAQQVDDPPGPTDGPELPRSAEERLIAALEALAARDRVLAERSRRLVTLEEAADRLSAATARLQALSSDLAALRLARQAELAERDARIAELEAALIQARRAGETRAQAPDDLRRIRGIGPVIESLLHGMGITTFRQIAALSPEELRRVGDMLGVFRGRIQRDRWTEQAAELAGGHTTPTPE